MFVLKSNKPLYFYHPYLQVVYIILYYHSCLLYEKNKVTYIFFTFCGSFYALWNRLQPVHPFPLQPTKPAHADTHTLMIVWTIS